MKKLCSVALISIVLLTSVFGTSTALAQTESNVKKEVSVSREVSSDNQTTNLAPVPTATPRQVYAVNTELMKELDRLVKMLEEAEHKGDKELVRALLEKIKVIKREIEKASEKPKATEKPGKPQLIAEKPEVAPREVTVVKPRRVDKCTELKAWESKRKYYEALYASSDEELKDKGYRGGKEEVAKILKELDAGIKRIRVECETGVASSAGGGGTAAPAPTERVTIALTPKPVAVVSGDEIRDYYKLKIAKIATGEVDAERKIASLKELRNEIDRLIAELIKSKDKISTKEVSGLVNRIEVKPGEVKMDKVVVETVAKSVAARVSNRDLEIKPTSAQVIIRDGNLEVKALDLSIEDEVLRVGVSEVKLMPSAAIKQIRVEPSEIELKEENARAVYKIRAAESRKLLGFIPVKVEKTLTVDAANTEAKVIEEAKPWWSFLTTK